MRLKIINCKTRSRPVIRAALCRAVACAVSLSVLSAISTNAVPGNLRPYHGTVLAKKSTYPAESLGQFIEVCDPALDSDKSTRNQNDAYCEGYSWALLQAAAHYNSACFPTKGAAVSLVLSVGHLRSIKDKSALQRPAFTEFMQVLPEQFPCAK